MRPAIIIAAFCPAVLASCDESISRQDLVGSWVYPGEDCNGDGGVTFNADGTWGAYDVGGKWSLEDNILTTVILERGEPGVEASSRSVVPPEQHRYTIVTLSEER